MAGMELIEPTYLYNLLNQGTIYPCISDPNYLLLLDARTKDDYAESHVITAKKAPKNENEDFIVPYDAELECKQHIIVYDSNTRSLKEDGAAFDCAKVLWEMGSRHAVKVLKGGYEDFSALYPFLRTQKIINMPRELDEIRAYPVEVIPGLLYLGNWKQGNAAYIQKDLRVKGHINCCVEEESFFKEKGQFLLHIPVEDSEDSDLYSKFQTACSYVDDLQQKGDIVLVFSKLGISRSATIAIAYVMHHFKWTLEESYHHLQKCCSTLRPNRGFIDQLSKWEEDLFGQKSTDINDPNF